MMIPMYNEEKTIRFKLENLAKLRYPREKLQILLVNDASTDGTLDQISSFSKDSSFPFTTIKLQARNGKIKALNTALKYANGEIVVVSDSDAFLSPDALCNAMPFFADPSTGGVVSIEKPLYANMSWVNETEDLYNRLSYGTIRLGESKIHSTLIFNGAFAAYRRSLLDSFNVETDDTGTALDIVQKGSRTIMVPDVVSFTLEFETWKEKLNVKVRRAKHNLKTWFRCLRLLFEGSLLLPKRIAIPEILLYLINPLILLNLFVMTIIILSQSPFFALLLVSALLPVLVVKRMRLLSIEILQNNWFLLFAILSLIFKNKIIRWEPTQTARAALRREMLENRGLV